MSETDAERELLDAIKVIGRISLTNILVIISAVQWAMGRTTTQDEFSWVFRELIQEE